MDLRQASSRVGVWLAGRTTVARWWLVVLALAAAGATFAVDRELRPDGASSTQLHTVTGVVEFVQADGSGLCLTKDTEPPELGGECYEAVNVLRPMPAAGQRVSLTYALVPYSPGSPGSTNRVVAIKILD